MTLCSDHQLHQECRRQPCQLSQRAHQVTEALLLLLQLLLPLQPGWTLCVPLLRPRAAHPGGPGSRSA